MVFDPFVIREGRPSDLSDLYRLARYLNSYNLPADRKRLARLVTDSVRSFAGKIPPARARYLFVLEEAPRRRVVGCSLIIAKHGTPGSPHLFLDSFIEERRSRTLRKTVRHHCLRLGATTDGPTEVGGLVVLPSHRDRPERLGRRLSFVRFLYMAACPERFQKEVLSELLPAFSAKGESPFWEYFGRKFTGFTYRQADRLSIDNKEFILSLFPRATLYQDFFPRHIRDGLGRVGEKSRPGARTLEKIGFRYLHQIEPFDGGPYYGAKTRSIAVVRRARRLNAAVGAVGASGNFMVMRVQDGRLRAVVSPGRPSGRRLVLPPHAAAALGATAGDAVWAVRFE